MLPAVRKCSLHFIPIQMMLVNEHLSGCDATTPTFEQKARTSHLEKTTGKDKDGKGNEAWQKETEEKAKERKK